MSGGRLEEIVRGTGCGDRPCAESRHASYSRTYVPPHHRTSLNPMPRRETLNSHTTAKKRLFVCFLSLLMPQSLVIYNLFVSLQANNCDYSVMKHRFVLHILLAVVPLAFMAGCSMKEGTSPEPQPRESLLFRPDDCLVLRHPVQLSAAACGNCQMMV